jgi:uncharacterized OB-fold protein
VTDAVGYDDPLTAPFWDGARAGELRMPRCRACGRVVWYPRPICPSCGGWDLEWVPLSGLGTIHSQVVVRVPVSPGLEPPYVVALVDIDEGPRFLAGIDAPVGSTRIGDRVRVVWRARPDLPPLAMFTLDT